MEEAAEPIDPEPEVDPAEEESVEEPAINPDSTSRLASIDKKKAIFVVFIVIAVIALIAGAIVVYKRGMSKRETAPAVPVASPSPTPTITEVPEASPPIELKREDLKLQVLNGSGVAGTAGEAKEFLEGLGYQDIEVGNADSYDYEETEISIKEEKEDYLELLTNDLKGKYSLSTESATLDEESEFDVVVIIGSS